MSELEKRVRELTLREPGDTLDQRALSCFQGSGNVAARESGRSAHTLAGAANALQVNSPPKNEPTRTRRGIFWGTSSGLLAALLFGIAIGNGLPSIWSRFGGSQAIRSSAMPTAGGVLSAHDMDSGDPDADSEFPDRHPMLPDLSMHLRDALQNRSTVGSQFMESGYLSAIAGASLWERENAEKFNVTPHVSDRRFDICRDCHRVGG